MSPLKPSTMKNEGMSLSSQLLTPLIDFGEPEEKRTRRKPNFTVQERMHLAQSYVENYEEYNRASHSRTIKLKENHRRMLHMHCLNKGKGPFFDLNSKTGFTPITKGEAKIGRQRLLERWAAELSCFGIVERTPVEVEQKIRDYMKKIATNRKRAVKRAMSPPCQLISSVVSESSSVDDSTTDDSLTAYAGFLLEQHRATQNDCTENFESLSIANSSNDVEEIKPIMDESANNTRKSCRKRKASDMSPLPNKKEPSMEMLETSAEVVPSSSEVHKQQTDFGHIDLALKTVYAEIARKELEKKTLEVETMRINLEIKKLELEGKRHDVEKKRLELQKMQRSVVKDSLTIRSSESKGTLQDTLPTDQFDPEIKH